MNVLVLGGHGMAGHMIVNYFKSLKEYEITFTHRSPAEQEGIYLDVRKEENLRNVLRKVQPDVVINCVGILNQSAAEYPIDAIKVNSLLPHILKSELSTIGGKLIHISTDCVFDGMKGNYSESAQPDGSSMYAKTKALGEVTEDPHLTIRTSIIGPELKDGIGLFNWFMKQKGEVNGYTNVLWNGVTTLELAKTIQTFIQQDINGLYHLTAPESISKYALLLKFQKIFNKTDIVIHPFENAVCDRTLLNTRKELDHRVPHYDEMLLELRDWMKVNAYR
ncbi:dTDP-4-dehydrorhamnose reductase family protein [Pseudalkalibacillus sp. R45]|uniref:dTDP-4-dehydrorhamnose reductase family protein n=1 Tax=Pseudalkalibacillus sp. R45 TaxID=3457433 RepID=UPI003FCD7555